MTITIDQLIQVLMKEETDDAGIAAVVRAVRPKLVLWFHAIDQNVTEKTAAKFADDFINEILGDAGDEAAGGSSSNADKATEAGGARCATTSASAPATTHCPVCNGKGWDRFDSPCPPCEATGRVPATDPAPAVCEWTRVGLVDDNAWISCGAPTGKFCPSCGKPIKFTEAKT